MKLQILPAAINDLSIGKLFYERQAEGVGDYFFDSLFSDIDSLILYAGIHKKEFGFYRFLSNKFPYAIYYKVTNKIVLVYRVLDLRQNPKQLKKYLVQ